MDDSSKFFEQLAVSVAGGARIRTAVKEIGCSESHGYHLSSSPLFKSRVAELRAEITSAAVGRLSSASTVAVDTLVTMLDSDYEPSVRLQAAKAILSALGPVSEVSELRDRLKNLESEKK